MAASPRARDRTAVSWRCSRGRSLVLHLSRAHARAPARKSSPQRIRPLADEMRVLPRKLLLKFIACGCRLMFSFGHDANFFFFVVDERVWRHAVCEKNVRADGGIGADHGVTAHDRSSGINANAVFDRWVAFFSAQGLSRRERARDERDALVKLHVRPNLRGLANDDAGAVIDE